MELTVLDVQYHPSGAIGVLVEDEMGGRRYINTTEAKVLAFAPPGTVNWGNEEVTAAAQAALDDPEGDFGAQRPKGAPLLAGKGHTVMWPTLPAPEQQETPPPGPE